MWYQSICVWEDEVKIEKGGKNVKTSRNKSRKICGGRGEEMLGFYPYSDIRHN
jgi:hypothetical protein